MSARRPRAEEDLVKALLAHPSVAAEVREGLALEEFESEECRAIFGAVLALIDQGSAQDLAGRLHFEDERLTRLVTKWMTDPGPLAEELDAQRAAQECAQRIHERRMKRERREVQEKIRSAQEAGRARDRYGTAAYQAELARSACRDGLIIDER